MRMLPIMSKIQIKKTSKGQGHMSIESPFNMDFQINGNS